MVANPLKTRLCQELGIEFPIVAFSHCKDVVEAVVNAGGLAVLGVGVRTPDEIEREIRWIREHVGDKPFGMDVLIPASVPPSGSKEDLREQIPPAYWEFVEGLKRDSNIPPLTPNPPKDTEGRREGSGRGWVRELQGRWPGLLG